MKTKSCYECCCTETSDNPIIEAEDDLGNIVDAICLECYTAMIISEPKD